MFVGMEHFKIDEVQARGGRVLIRYAAEIAGHRIGVKWDGVVVCGIGASGKLGCIGPLKTTWIEEWYASSGSASNGVRINYRCRADLRDGDVLEVTHGQALTGVADRGDPRSGPAPDGPRSCEELPFWGKTKLTFP
jgi:hypothetical protein